MWYNRGSAKCSTNAAPNGWVTVKRAVGNEEYPDLVAKRLCCGQVGGGSLDKPPTS